MPEAKWAAMLSQQGERNCEELCLGLEDEWADGYQCARTCIEHAQVEAASVKTSISRSSTCSSHEDNATRQETLTFEKDTFLTSGKTILEVASTAPISHEHDVESSKVNVIAKDYARARGRIEIEEPEEFKLGHQGTREVCRVRAQEAPGIKRILLCAQGRRRCNRYQA